jgi:hypothetical protein
LVSRAFFRPGPINFPTNGTGRVSLLVVNLRARLLLLYLVT